MLKSICENCNINSVTETQFCEDCQYYYVALDEALDDEEALIAIYRKCGSSWHRSLYLESVKRNHLKLIRWLYNNKMKINPVDTINTALECGRYEIVQFVASHCKDSVCVHDDAFIKAISQNNMKMYRVLSKYGDPNPDGLRKCIEIAIDPRMIKFLKNIQKELDGPRDNLDGPQGIRGPRGCIGHHCLCIM